MFKLMLPWWSKASNRFGYHLKLSDLMHSQGRLEAGSTCSKHTGAEGAATVNRAPNAKGKSAKREMNTVNFWLEPALQLPFEFVAEIYWSSSGL